MKPGLLLLFALFASPAVAGTKDVIVDGAPPAGWVVVSPPAMGRDLECLQSRFDLPIHALSREDDGAVRIGGWKEPDSISLRLPDGRFVGEDRGEWGGRIGWFPTEPSAAASRAGPLVEENVNPVAFVAHGGDVFVAEGLAHLGMDSGQVLRMQRVAGGWKATPFADLGSAPDSALADGDGSWFVLTRDAIVRVDLDTGAVESVHRNEAWRWSIRRTMQAYSGGFLVGGRRAVVRLTRDDEGLYAEDWLVPAECRELRGPDCECRP